MGDSSIPVCAGEPAGRGVRPHDSVRSVTPRAIGTAALAWACLLPPGSAAAQGNAAAIEGRITNDTLQPVAGATVTAVNPTTGFERVTATDADGRFVLLGLPVGGEYDLRAEAPGFSAAVRRRVAPRSDQRLAIDFTLRLAARDAVAVEVAATLLDVVRGRLQQTIDEGLIRALPVSGRGFMPLSALATGFTGHPDFPNPHGQLFSTNNVLVDGASHFSKWRSAARSFSSGLPLEAVRQVQVLAGLFPAEFGEGLASVTSVTTRTGTNQWHGSALVFAHDAALAAVPPFSSRKPPGSGYQYGFSLGGPLVVNRSHFFGSYERRRSQDRNVVVSPAAPDAEVPDDRSEHLVFFRVDHTRRGHLHSARYHREQFRWHNEPGGLVLPGSGTGYATDVQSLLAYFGLPVSSRGMHELRVQFSRFVHRRRDLQRSPYVWRAGYSVEGGSLGPSGFDADPEETLEVSDTLSHGWGAHALRLGGGAKHVRARNTRLPYGWGAYFFAGRPDRAGEPYLFVQSLAPTGEAMVAEPRSLSAFGFVQTDWTVRPDLRVNLGLRYDVERVSRVRGYDVPADTDNLQPRVGVAWDLDGRGLTVVRGGVGLYSQQHLLYSISRVQLEGVNGAVSLTLAPNSPSFPVFPAPLTALPAGERPPRDIYRVAPDFRNPYSVQSTAGVQRAFAGGVLSADYVYLSGRDLVSLVDANAPAPLAKPASRTVDEADATRPVPPAVGGFRKILTLGNRGRSWYHALEVKFDRTRGPLHLIAAYTRSRAEDMANDALPEDSRDLRADRARSSADIPHNVTAGFEWSVPGSRPLTRGWSLAGVGMYRSRRPYTISWGDDRNGTTQNDARPGQRNTGETGPYRTIDLALTRRFQWRAATIDARAQVFNALNATNYEQYVGELLSPLFGRPVSAFPPRRIEIAAIVRF